MKSLDSRHSQRIKHLTHNQGVPGSCPGGTTEKGKGFEQSKPLPFLLYLLGITVNIMGQFLGYLIGNGLLFSLAVHAIRLMLLSRAMEVAGIKTVGVIIKKTPAFSRGHSYKIKISFLTAEGETINGYPKNFIPRDISISTRNNVGKTAPIIYDPLDPKSFIIDNVYEKYVSPLCMLVPALALIGITTYFMLFKK